MTSSRGEVLIVRNTEGMESPLPRGQGKRCDSRRQTETKGKQISK